jgi:hypothetical protein
MADAQAPEEERFDLIKPSGDHVTVPKSSLAEAKAKGYRLETDEEFQKRYNEKEYGGLGNQLLAGGLGAARTLTFGLSDLGATKFGIAAPATLSGLKEENPKASLTGEVAGAVVPLLLGDVPVVGGAAESLGAGVEGVSALGHAAKHGVSHLLGGLAETGASGLAKKVLPMVAEGAVEGAAYGAGNAISESALGDHELTAEKLLAGAGMGALLGGGIQGVLGVGGAGLSSMKRMAEKKLEGTLGESVQSWVDEFAENQRLRAAGLGKKAFKAMDEEGAKPYLRKESLKILDEMAAEKPIMSQKEIAEGLVERLAQAEENRSSIVTKLDELAGGDPSRSFRVGDVVDTIKEEALRGVEPASQRNVVRAVDDYIAALKETYGEDGVVDFSKASSIRAGAQNSAKFDMAVPQPIQKMWQRVSRKWNDLIDEKAAPLLKEAGLDEAAYRAARQKEGVLFDLVKFAKDKVAANIPNRSVSLTDMLGGVAGASVGGLPGAVAGAAVNKVGRVYGPSAMATVAEKAAKILAAARSAARITNETDALLAEWVEGAQQVGQRVVKASNKAGERYAEKVAHHEIAGGEHVVEKTAVPVTAKILDSVRFLPKGHDTSSMAADARPLTGKPDEAMEKFRERAAEITALASSPDKLVDHVAGITSQVSDASPLLASHLGDKIMQAVSYLHEVMPKSPTAANPLIREPWSPSRSEVDKFARRIRAASDPRTIIHDLKAGTLTKEAVETAKQLYPKLYQDMVKAIASKLSEAPANFSYRNRAQLSLLLGEPLDASMSPAFVGAMQQQWQSLPQNQGQGGGGTRVTGIGKMAGGESIQTRSQRLSGGP